MHAKKDDCSQEICNTICRKYSYDMRNNTIVCVTQTEKTVLDMTNRFLKVT